MNRAMIAGALGAMVALLVSPAVEAASCDAEIDSEVAVPGEKSASAHAECSGPAGPNATLTGELVRDQDGYQADVRRTIDLDGDGDNETSDGFTSVGIDCPPPEEQGVVKGVACSL